MYKKRWTNYDREQLFSMLEQGKCARDIAIALGREYEAVRAQIHYLRHPERRLYRYSALVNSMPKPKLHFINYATQHGNIKADGYFKGHKPSRYIRNKKKNQCHNVGYIFRSNNSMVMIAENTDLVRLSVSAKADVFPCSRCYYFTQDKCGKPQGFEPCTHVNRTDGKNIVFIDIN